MNKLTIKVVRRWLGDNETIGRVLIGGAFAGMYSLEDKLRPKGEKIAGFTAIPGGTYQVDITWSPKFKRMMPIILNVPGFTGIRIHPGNTAEDTEGCLLVGMERGSDSIARSTEAYDRIYGIIDNAKKQDKKVYITFVTIEQRILRTAAVALAGMAAIWGIYKLVKN